MSSISTNTCSSSKMASQTPTNGPHSNGLDSKSTGGSILFNEQLSMNTSWLHRTSRHYAGKNDSVNSNLNEITEKEGSLSHIDIMKEIADDDVVSEPELWDYDSQSKQETDLPSNTLIYDYTNISANPGRNPKVIRALTSQKDQPEGLEYFPSQDYNKEDIKQSMEETKKKNNQAFDEVYDVDDPVTKENLPYDEVHEAFDSDQELQEVIHYDNDSSYRFSMDNGTEMKVFNQTLQLDNSRRYDDAIDADSDDNDDLQGVKLNKDWSSEREPTEKALSERVGNIRTLRHHSNAELAKRVPSESTPLTNAKVPVDQTVRFIKGNGSTYGSTTSSNHKLSDRWVRTTPLLGSKGNREELGEALSQPEKNQSIESSSYNKKTKKKKKKSIAGEGPNDGKGGMDENGNPVSEAEKSSSMQNLPSRYISRNGGISPASTMGRSVFPNGLNELTYYQSAGGHGNDGSKVGKMTKHRVKVQKEQEIPKAEEVSGYRGREEKIEELIKFIESPNGITDRKKKNKTAENPQKQNEGNGKNKKKKIKDKNRDEQRSVCSENSSEKGDDMSSRQSESFEEKLKDFPDVSVGTCSKANSDVSELLNMDDPGNDPFIFTDIDREPVVQDEFQQVKAKKKNRTQPQQPVKKQFVPVYREPRVKRTVPQRSVTPPPSNQHSSPAKESALETMLTHGEFPRLGQREARRSSTGDVPLDTNNPDDSDLESVKSLPLGHLDGTMSPPFNNGNNNNSVLSYARMVAKPKNNVKKCEATSNQNAINPTTNVPKSLASEQGSFGEMVLKDDIVEPSEDNAADGSKFSQAVSDKNEESKEIDQQAAKFKPTSESEFPGLPSQPAAEITTRTASSNVDFASAVSFSHVSDTALRTKNDDNNDVDAALQSPSVNNNKDSSIVGVNSKCEKTFSVPASRGQPPIAVVTPMRTHANNATNLHENNENNTMNANDSKPKISNRKPKRQVGSVVFLDEKDSFPSKDFGISFGYVTDESPKPAVEFLAPSFNLDENEDAGIVFDGSFVHEDVIDNTKEEVSGGVQEGTIPPATQAGPVVPPPTMMPQFFPPHAMLMHPQGMPMPPNNIYPPLNMPPPHIVPGQNDMLEQKHGMATMNGMVPYPPPMCNVPPPGWVAPPSGAPPPPTPQYEGSQEQVSPHETSPSIDTNVRETAAPQEVESEQSIPIPASYVQENDPNFDPGRFDVEEAIHFLQREWKMLKQVEARNPNSVIHFSCD